MSQSVSELPNCEPHDVSDGVERWFYGSTTFLRSPELGELMIVNNGATIKETNLVTGITTVDFVDDF